MQAGDEGAQAAGVEGVPVGEPGLFGEGEDLQQVAAVAVEGVRGDLALAAQMFEEGIGRRASRTARRAQRTERSGEEKRGSTRARTSAT